MNRHSVSLHIEKIQINIGWRGFFLVVYITLSPSATSATLWPFTFIDDRASSYALWLFTQIADVWYLRETVRNLADGLGLLIAVIVINMDDINIIFRITQADMVFESSVVAAECCRVVTLNTALAQFLYTCFILVILLITD